jgi:antitoxin MazE
MQVEIVKWGNSSAVRLPAAVLKELDVAQGDRLELRMDAGKIVLEPAQREYELDELVNAITPQNRHELVDFGAPQGREAW